MRPLPGAHNMNRRIVYRYKRLGKSTVDFNQTLVWEERDVRVLLLERHDGPSVIVEGVTTLESGAPILWFVFPGQWHDVGRFHLLDKQFTGWYTNICTPVEQDGDTWSSTDLFIDHWQPVKGEGKWLDEDEFAEARRAKAIDDEMAERALREQRDIMRLVVKGAWPPAAAQTIDLKKVGY